MRQYRRRATAKNRHNMRGTTQVLVRLLVPVLHGRCKVPVGGGHRNEPLQLHLPSAAQLPPQAICGYYASDCTWP